MQRIMLTSLVMLASFTMNAENDPASVIQKELAKQPAVSKTISPNNVDPCLDAALSAQANAFAQELSGHGLCHASVVNGSLAASEYGGCCFAFTLIRQITVAQIQSTFVPCPSGNGVGIA